MAQAAVTESGTSIRADFERDGYFAPLDVISTDEAMVNRAELERLESQIIGQRLGNKGQLSQAHSIFRFANDLVRNTTILDAVEELIGPDILVWGSTFFTKEAQSPSYVSWHQDLRYWGLSSDDLVSVWIALGPAKREHGCMRFVPGSHKFDILEHRDTFDDANFLTRGQEAVIDIDEDETVLVELEAGQASMHHGRLLHSSGPNEADQRRVGFVVNYLAPSMRQVVANEDFAMLVRGQDNHGHFIPVPAPQGDLTPEALTWHRRIVGTQNEAIYDGAGVIET
jgi:non-haem Fe2+, alpha-ketoglutarate-dependent halogenase